MSLVCAKFISKMLSVDRRATRVLVAQNLLYYEDNAENSLKGLGTTVCRYHQGFRNI